MEYFLTLLGIWYIAVVLFWFCSSVLQYAYRVVNILEFGSGSLLLFYPYLFQNNYKFSVAQ